MKSAGLVVTAIESHGTFYLGKSYDQICLWKKVTLSCDNGCTNEASSLDS